MTKVGRLGQADTPARCHLRQRWAGRMLPIGCVLLAFLIGIAVRGQDSTRLHSVLASVEVQTNPPAISLHWPADPKAQYYQQH